MIELAEFIDEVAAKYDSLGSKKLQDKKLLQDFYTKLAVVYNRRSGKAVFKKRLVE
jgi:hypothetical protein